MAMGQIKLFFSRHGDLKSQNPSNSAVKKSRESELRRRRRKQKKNTKASQDTVAGDDSDTAAEDVNGTANDSSIENSDPQKVLLRFLFFNFDVMLRDSKDNLHQTSKKEERRSVHGCWHQYNIQMRDEMN
ncbi:Splicing factor 3B subunit [Abeliophyllum distichum]|uniref:Splicing factor 3B subunit n=1 Tax=Abeliophyllum distichum TaxID=126358 RepID=A0ABD1Q5Q9_9LAMI